VATFLTSRRAINEFEGGVVIVSHDFRLITRVAKQLWEVKDRKIVDLSRQDISIVGASRAAAEDRLTPCRVQAAARKELCESDRTSMSACQSIAEEGGKRKRQSLLQKRRGGERSRALWCSLLVTVGPWSSIARHLIVHRTTCLPSSPSSCAIRPRSLCISTLATRARARLTLLRNATAAPASDGRGRRRTFRSMRLRSPLGMTLARQPRRRRSMASARITQAPASQPTPAAYGTVVQSSPHAPQSVSSVCRSTQSLDPSGRTHSVSGAALKRSAWPAGVTAHHALDRRRAYCERRMRPAGDSAVHVASSVVVVNEVG